MWHCRGQRLGPLSGSAADEDNCPVCFDGGKKEGQTEQPFIERFHGNLSFFHSVL